MSNKRLVAPLFRGLAGSAGKNAGMKAFRKLVWKGKQLFSIGLYRKRTLRDRFCSGRNGVQNR